MVVEIGLIAPPVGLNVYVVNGIARDVPMAETYRGVVPFLVTDAIRVALLLFFPVALAVARAADRVTWAGTHDRARRAASISPRSAGFPTTECARTSSSCTASASTGARGPTCRSTKRSPSGLRGPRLRPARSRHLAGPAPVRAELRRPRRRAARAVALAADEAEGRPVFVDRRQPRRTRRARVARSSRTTRSPASSPARPRSTRAARRRACASSLPLLARIVPRRAPDARASTSPASRATPTRSTTTSPTR